MPFFLESKTLSSPMKYFYRIDFNLIYNFFMKKFSNLPHLDLEEHYQFITFRTYDSVDSYLKKLQSSNLKENIKQYQVDRYLDNSLNGSYFYKDNIELMREILFEDNSSLYELIAFAIMPNHIHLLIKQKKSLKEIIKQIKGKSAFLLNKKLNKKGKFWASEYYDKAIRDERHFFTTMEYILNNPIKAKLKDSKQRVYCRYFDEKKL